MNSYFLPVGLLLALVVAVLVPTPGALLHQAGLVPWMVVTIFLVNGYQVDLKKLPRAGRVARAAVVATIISLLLSPLIGLATVSLSDLPADVALGLVVMATVPPTLSSGIVMTQVAGGNVPKALFLTILLNLIGVLSVPFMLQFVLGSAGLVSISPWSVFRQLILLVLLPFILGAIIRRFAGAGASGHWLLRYLPSACVIATVWMAASSSSGMLKALDAFLLLLILGGALLIHGSLLLLCYLARYLYRPEYGEWQALLFTTSQKTLPIALGLLALIGPGMGAAMVACIVFHFVQLLLDSAIASRMARGTVFGPGPGD